MVSVVIPTYRRPAVVRRAVESVLGQTYRDVEVMVVSDGPDAEARAAVEGLGDERVRYMEMAVNGGPAVARSAGVRASRGQWVSFLDDDDLLLPEMVERMMAAADEAKPETMIACRAVFRYDGREDVWPDRPIGPEEDIADYLLVRPSLLGRPGVVSLGLLLIHRSVLERVPFQSHKDHEDWAWMLEAWHLVGARLKFVWAALAVYNIDTQSLSRSRRKNWEQSMEWAMEYRKWMSDAAFTSFLATKVAIKAKRAGDWGGLWKISKAVMRSRPRLLDVAFLCGVVLLPGFVLQGAWRRSLRKS